MSEDIIQKKSLMSRRFMFGTTVGGAVIFFVVGIIFWGGFNTAMEATNTLPFCISCHEMEENVYQEYKPTIHYSNRTGVRATCPDCHVPRPWIHKMVRKIQASNEVYHKIMGTVSTPEKFDKERLTMAKRVWKAMKSTDSRECRNCHNFVSMNPEYQRPRARKQHLNAFKTGQTCIDCHKGIAHKNVRDQVSEEELEALEKPNPAFIREVPQMFIDGLARIEEQEKAEKEKARAEKAAELEKQKAMAAAAGTAPAAAASSGADFGIDWGKAPIREVTIFYPGETSMEWILTGKDHGGARAFQKAGDRCFDCHDQETADMGPKMVTGQKAETTPMPDKRASILVNVQAAHDDENLFLRFEWEDTPHVPVPFVDGGKMDPDNQIKLAIMLATDDVEYADRAGCWGTCHHDARSMPDAPDAAAIGGSPAASALDTSAGITKYILESRSEIEIKGKNDAKRGGWDKLNDADAIKAALDEGKFMDLLRYKSGSGETEDGYILDQRVMTGGQGFEASAGKVGNNWVVEIKRKLTSDKPGDLSLAMDQVYNIGFAIHDDYTNARYHHVSLGYKLGFDKGEDEVEINAVAK